MYAVVFHAHQKIDKAAYKQLKKMLPAGTFFPSIENVVHFDGKNGPDSLKLKKHSSGSQPWHFIDPNEVSDTNLTMQITKHYKNLVENLRNKDEVRSAFEAAWLAHALVDGLTPAHHYPYKEQLELIHGENKPNIKGIVGRAYVKSSSVTSSIKDSYKLVGPKGLITAHFMFEAGAYMLILPMRLAKLLPSASEFKILATQGVLGLFNELVKEITTLDLYSRFKETGWTVNISQDIKNELAPRMVHMITLAWYAASIEAAKA